MTSYKTQAGAYKETRVRTAGPGRIIVMLYDEAIKQLELATQLLESRTRQLDQVNNAVIKAQNVITELMVSLDFDRGGAFAKNLFALYLYFNNQLGEANIQKDPAPMVLIKDQLSDIRSAWAQIADTTPGPDAPVRTGLNIAG